MFRKTILTIESFPKINDVQNREDDSANASGTESGISKPKPHNRSKQQLLSLSPKGRLKNKSLSCESLNQRNHKSPLLKRRKSAEEVCRISYPCQWACPNCAFTRCLGPVKVYVSRFYAPKEKCIQEITDGRGQAIFPQSRRKELKGLVYDKDTYSLFPLPPRDLRKQTFTDRQKIFY